MQAKTIKGKSPEEIQSALQQSMEDARPDDPRLNDSVGQAVGRGFKPTLAIVFISIKQDIKAICDILDKQEISIFGATSCGEFIDGEISNGEIAILLLDMKKTDFKILIENYYGRDAEEVAKVMGLSALESFKNPSFLISNSFEITNIIDFVSIISGLERAVGSHLTIWGGNAGDDRIFDHSLVFTNHQCLQTGTILLVIDGDKIKMKGQAAFGWKPAGTMRTVTRSDKDSIYTIDNEPALDIVFKFLGLKLTKEEAEKFNPGSASLCIMREDGSTVMRNANSYNWDEKSIAVAGKIEPGTKFRFALPPDFEVVETVTNDAQQIRDTEFPDADALVMFSCVSRPDELGPMVSTEIDGVKNIFNAPMVGFFTYGEYGRATNGKNEFHNTTCCWVALKEKNHPPPNGGIMYLNKTKYESKIN